jgi:hypothetical protein
MYYGKAGAFSLTICHFAEIGFGLLVQNEMAHLDINGGDLDFTRFACNHFQFSASG